MNRTLFKLMLAFSLCLGFTTSCASTRVTSDSLTGVTVQLEHRIFRSLKGSETWLAFGEAGQLGQVRRSGEGPAELRAVTPHVSRYSVTDEGLLRLEHALDPSIWEGTWLLTSDQLILGAFLRVSDLEWRLVQTRSRPDGTQFRWCATLVFERPLSEGAPTRGKIELDSHASEPQARQLVAHPTMDGWQLRDVTGDGNTWNLPEVHFDLERGLGRLLDSSFGGPSRSYPRRDFEALPEWAAGALRNAGMPVR